MKVKMKGLFQISRDSYSWSAKSQTNKYQHYKKGGDCDILFDSHMLDKDNVSMLIISDSKIGKLISNNFFSLVIILITSILYGVYNNDYYGDFLWFFIVFCLAFFASKRGTNPKIFRNVTIFIN